MNDELDMLLEGAPREPEGIVVGPRFEAFFSWLYRIVEWLCLLAMSMQVVIVVYVVAGRFLFNKTPRWGEELALLFMVWLSLLSAVLAVKNDLHIRVSIVDRLFGERGVKIRDTVYSLLCMAFSAALFVGGLRLTRMSARTILPGSGISLAWLNASICVAGFALALIYVYVIGDLLCRRRR